jgi:hypothetical protein
MALFTVLSVVPFCSVEARSQGDADTRAGTNGSRPTARHRCRRHLNHLRTNQPTQVTQVLSGTWGGEHVKLIVTDVTATIEFDCAHGTLDRPLALDGSGHFDVGGSFVREHGGPNRVDEDPDQQASPARYAGIVNRAA